MTMDAPENIRTRRSIRKCLDKPVPQGILQQVLVAAMYAPSACINSRGSFSWSMIGGCSARFPRSIPTSPLK
jgi:nitroreductase